jgi:predicted kinase
VTVGWPPDVTRRRARREKARALARERRLDEVARDEEAAWSRVEAMIATRKPGEYDAVVTLLTDLQALAERKDRYDTFTLRTTALRQTHARKPSLIDRLDRAGI